MSTETASLILKVESGQVALGQQRLTALTHSAERAETATNGLRAAFGKLMAVFGAVMALKESVTQISEFEQRLASVKAVSGATAQEMQLLTEAAHKFGSTSNYSGKEAAEGMKMLAQAGFTAKQTLAAMPGLMALATAGELNLADSADIVGSSLAGFSLQAEEAGRVADVLATAANAANTDVKDMGEGMKYVAPVAAAMRISLEETAATMGVMSNAGIKGSMAGTGLREVLSSLASPSREAANVLEAYGLTIQEVNPETNKLSDVLEKLKAANISATDAMVVFGARGAPALLSLTSQLPQLRELRVQMDNAKGSAQKMADVMGDTLSGDISKLKNNFLELVTSVGEQGASKALREYLQWLTQVEKKMTEFMRSGEAAAWFDWFSNRLSIFQDDWIKTYEIIDGIVQNSYTKHQAEADSALGWIKRAFMNLPENVLTSMRLVGTAFGALDTIAKEVFGAFYKTASAYISAVTSYSLDQFNIIKEYLFNSDAYEVKVERATNGSIQRISRVHKETGKALSDTASLTDRLTEASEKSKAAVGSAGSVIEATYKTAQDQIDAYLKTHDRLLKNSDEELIRIQRIRAEHEMAASTPTKKAGVPKTAPSAEGTASSTGFDKSGFMDLQRSLMTEEEAVRYSYLKRTELIRANTEEGGKIRSELSARLADRYLLEMDSAKDAEIDRLTRQFEATQNLLEDSLRKRLISEQEFQAASKDNWKTYTKGVSDVSTKGARQVMMTQLETQAQVVGLAANIAGQMSEMVQNNKSASKAMFITTKALAIAQAIIYAELGAARAVAEAGPFLGIPLSTWIRAMGYTSAALIAAQTVMAFEHGGMIGAGQVGLVGEAGAELVKGPAVVTSARSTAEILAAKSGSSGGQTVVNVHNYAGSEVETRESKDGDKRTVDIIIKKALASVASDIAQGSGAISIALGRSYGLSRGK